MHHLHTTHAFVLGTLPQGESSLTYRLFTRELGLLFAHAQGVRELKSRNRYALQTGGLSTVTLVRGREVWRLTGAEEKRDDAPLQTETAVRGRKMLEMVGKLLPVEDPAPEVFDILYSGTRAFAAYPDSLTTTIETVTVLRLLKQLGYVAEPLGEHAIVEQILGSLELSLTVLEQAQTQQGSLIGTVNSALREANP